MILPVISNFYANKYEKLHQSQRAVNFSGNVLQTGPKNDVFSPSEAATEYFTETYNNIQKSLEIIGKKEVELLAAKLNKRYPEVNKDEIFKIMDKLSVFSSYKSINSIAKALKDKGFLGIYDFAYEFTYKHKIVKDENEGNFFKNLSKGSKTQTQCQKTITQIPHSQGVPLGSIFDYLTYGKYPMDFTSKKLALVLDKNALQLLEKIKKSSPKDFRINFSENDTFMPVYIDDFENSYNFLNQGKSFEEAADDFVKKYREIKSKNPEFSTEKIIDEALNSENLQKIKELGFSPLRIDISNENQPNPGKIAENLKPVLPSKEKFGEIINDIAEKSRRRTPELMSKLILDYLNINLAVYSPRSLSKKLQTLQEKITETVKSKGYPEKNIYYTVLHQNKSFGLIAYQFQKANNIPDEKMLYWKGFGYQAEPDFNLPEKSTIVILDDCFISGNTVLYEMFDYAHEAFALNSQKKDVNIVFASVLATDSAINRIQKNIDHAKRSNHDAVICADKRKINWADKLTSRYVFDFFKLIRPDGKTFATTAVVFPFMGSDTNSPGLRPLFAAFVPNKNYLHNEVKTDDFFDD